MSSNLVFWSKSYFQEQITNTAEACLTPDKATQNWRQAKGSPHSTLPLIMHKGEHPTTNGPKSASTD